MCKTYQKLFLGGKNAGFTLIELLVVVLIIGILAAIVVPQYEKVVATSRVMTIVPLLRSIADAEQLYYMKNGNYTISFDGLDIQMPAGATKTIDTGGGDVLTYKGFKCYLRYGGDGSIPSLYSAYCSITRANYPNLERYFSQTNSICWASKSNTTGYEICQNISGKEVPDGENGKSYGFQF